MSYKTEFQSNNTDLQTILDTVNALQPDSGPEGFTVELSLAGTGVYVHYTNPNGVYTSVSGNSVTLGSSITVMKNSLLYVEVDEPAVGAPAVSDNATILYTDASQFYSSVIQIAGDCSIGGGA